MPNPRGLVLTLRDYQQRAVDQTREAFRQGARGVCLVLPTGAGKTVILAHVAAAHLSRGTRVVVYVHRDELMQQTEAKLRAVGLTPGSGVSVESVQTACRHTPQPASLVILDECVPAGTLVDGRPIESIRVNEVLSTGRVSRIMSRPVRGVVVRISTPESELVCTENHPIWVEGVGYVRAIEVSDGDMLRVRRTGASSGLSWSLEKDLLARVPMQEAIRDDVQHEPSLRERSDDRAESDEERGDPLTGELETEGDWTRPVSSRREREGSFGGGVGDVTGSGLADASSREPGSTSPWIPDELQARRGERGVKDRSGTRRGEPRLGSAAGAGQKEGVRPCLARVDRVEVLEPGSDGTYGGLCPGRKVYNLEVEGSECYFAGRPGGVEVLVHNCHHFGTGAAQWSALPRAHADAPRLGLTATPQRGDGTPLVGFDRLVVGVTARELTDLGHLVPCEVIAPARGGELADPVAALGEYAPGRPAVVYCANVRHAQEVAAAIGPDAACVDGDMPAERRASVLAAFQRGELRVLTNVFVLTEGWDAPRAEVCVIGRGCGCAGTWLQMIGRVLRPLPGKPRALVIDCKGSVYQHGLPTDERRWSLSGKAHALGERAISLRQCPECGGVFRSAPKCSRCGYVFPPPALPQARKMAMRMVDSVTPESVKRGHFQGLLGHARRKGYQPGWAMHQFKARWGHWPPREWMAA